MQSHQCMCECLSICLVAYDLLLLFVCVCVCVYIYIYIYIWQFHIGGWHRYARWAGMLSHQTSDLSHPCNLLPKGCDLCFTRYQVEGEKVVIHPATVKQLKSHLLKVLQKGLGTCILTNKSHYPSWLCSSPQGALRQPK